MREIKFRAWDGYRMWHDVGVMRGKPYDQGVGYYEVFSDREIDDGILMQYTGLKDKNGKEIYEGDIVRYPLYTGEIETDQVEWSVGPDSESYFSSGFRIGVLGFGEDMSEDVEVIGNIYEHSGLLKNEKA